MLTPIHDWLLQQGFGSESASLLTMSLEIVIVIVLAALSDVIAKRVGVRGLETLVGRTATAWDDIIVKRGVLHRLSHLAPALVVYLFAPTVLDGYEAWIIVIRRVALIYMSLMAVLAVDSALNAATDILHTSRVSRDLPVKSVVQVLRLMLYTIAAIAMVSLVIGQSPVLLLSGLGAMTAVRCSSSRTQF